MLLSLTTAIGFSSLQKYVQVADKRALFKWAVKSLTTILSGTGLIIKRYLFTYALGVLEDKY